MPIRAVGFDIDGTLYPNYRFNLRALPILIADLPLLLSMGKARDELRSERREGPFYQLQAEIAARHYKRPADEVRLLLDERIYRAWEKIFARVKPYSGVRGTALALRGHGLKLGVLSDFPAVPKLELLGLSGLWDCVLCSEEVGHLKPAPDSFLALAKALDTPPDEMLYVGNNPAYDVAGAKAAGMMAACISHRRKSVPGADFVFSSYRALERWILERA
jgi:HAD superfamily hydrolase (TIGR01549 family)